MPNCDFHQPTEPAETPKFAVFERDNWAMRTLFVIFVLALLAIGFEVYSDVSLTSANVSHAVRDVAAAAIAHGVKRE
jgi:hypothetical protein